jgi:RNA polymerase sigma-70 factor (TIGR02943 family)
MKPNLSPEKWVAEYADYLFSYALYKTSKRELAEDLVQDTFLSALKAKDGFKGDCAEKTWLVRILNNKIIDHYRSNKIGQDYEEYINETADNFHDAFFSKNEEGRWTNVVPPTNYASAADEYLKQNEFQGILDNCLQKIPIKLRQVFVEKYIDDRTAEEICTQYTLTSANYWVIIHRAKVLLRTCLERNEVQL